MELYAVYVVISQPTDIFFERMWLSAYSLKKYNPKMKVVCLVDDATYRGVQTTYRGKSQKVVDHFEIIDLPEGLSQRAKSRWIKTNLRSLLKGDFLFIDSDTVVCDDLSELELQKAELMMVFDYHLLLNEHKDGKLIRHECEQVFGRKLTTDDYFNSGVILARDTPEVHRFFDMWHKYWLEGVRRGCETDQKSLAYVVQDNPGVVRELDGIYNAQIRSSVRYLCRGKILHFFTGGDYVSINHPFMADAVYLQMKEENGISENVKQQVGDCKSLFDVQSYIMTGVELEIKNNASYRVLLLLRIYFPILYKINNMMACFLNVMLTKMCLKK